MSPSESDDAGKPSNTLDVIYGVEDVPGPVTCFLLGFQHYLTMFGATLSTPFILAPALCLAKDSVVVGELVGTVFFVSGIVTLLQTTFGCRLPIVQGGTFAFLAAANAILSQPQWKCPSVQNDTLDVWNVTSDNVSSVDDEWKPRMREIQGAIILASVVEVVVGLSGCVGLLMRFIGPLSIAPTITLIGLALAGVPARFCATQWWLAVMTIVLVVLFSQYLRDLKIPIGKQKSFYLFKLFPVLLALLIAWLVCYVLTVTDVLPADPDAWGHGARTDVKLEMIEKSSWFRVPYPGQWGMPTFSVAAVIGMLSGVLAGMIESIGDYYACARLTGAPPPPDHALNRGILVEGIGCIIAGFWGSGVGTTSYSENIGAIGITKVGSRRVVQVGGVIMLVLGMLGKVGAVFATIPDPLIGAILLVMVGIVMAVGVSNLQFVDLNSSRNLFVFGFAVISGLALPKWIAANPGAINTGSNDFDQVARILLTTEMFVGGLLGFVLDNTIPGTAEERGISKWRAQCTTEVDSTSRDTGVVGGHLPATGGNCYDLPFGMTALRRCKWARFVPISPTFHTSK